MFAIGRSVAIRVSYGLHKAQHIASVQRKSTRKTTIIASVTTISDVTNIAIFNKTIVNKHLRSRRPLARSNKQLCSHIIPQLHKAKQRGTLGERVRLDHSCQRSQRTQQSLNRTQLRRNLSASAIKQSHIRAMHASQRTFHNQIHARTHPRSQTRQICGSCGSCGTFWT